MKTKSLLFGLIGFLLGGLLVSFGGSIIHKRGTEPAASMSMSQMTESLKNKTGDEFDKAFLAEMINHHQGAIDMAKLAQSNARHGEIKKMADDIISAQSKETDMMQIWQTNWGYKGMPASHDMNMMNH